MAPRTDAGTAQIEVRRLMPTKLSTILVLAVRIGHAASIGVDPEGPPVPCPATTHHFVIRNRTDTKLGHDLGHAGEPACWKGEKGGCNIDALKMLCLYNPACAGFNSDGWLKSATTNTRPMGACDLYVKTAGAPTRTHYLKIEKWDADYEDLPHGRQGTKDIAVLEAACSNNTACAGFNSNGILKQTMNKTSHSTCDLYVKLGGDSHPLPPGPPPSPSPRPPPGPIRPPPAGPWAPYIWPLPKTYTNGSTTLIVSKPRSGEAGFFKLVGGHVPKTLTDAFERYTHLTLPHNTEPADPTTVDYARMLTEVTVTVDNLSEDHPQLQTNESYSLTVTVVGTASIHAATIYGALRGLETFSQLVRFDFDVEQHTLPLAPWTIVDAPRYPHRGLMMDTSRHFETVATIKRLIDSLSFAKLNVLHWHMSDSQSFPFESKTHPKLWMAAYSPQERYTQADVTAVVEYARSRGVRVMVEFDMPGHAGSWCLGYPEVCPEDGECAQPLNVASPATFPLISDLLGECTGGKPFAGLFPESMIHLGGDEVNTKCWAQDPKIMAWLNESNRTLDGGYGYFVNKTASIAVQQGRRPVQWNEVWDHFGTLLPKEAIVHAWNDRDAMRRATAAGYSALNSQGWYLDHLATSWMAMYTNDPNKGVYPNKTHLVLGGQGEMWGETVDTSDIESTVWPRLAAIAEKLWSPESVTSCPATETDTSDSDGTAAPRSRENIAIGHSRASVSTDSNKPQNCTAIDSAYPRLAEFRCLLNRRGVRAAPVLNGEARSAPHGPGGCLVQ